MNPNTTAAPQPANAAEAVLSRIREVASLVPSTETDCAYAYRLGVVAGLMEATAIISRFAVHPQPAPARPEAPSSAAPSAV